MECFTAIGLIGLLVVMISTLAGRHAERSIDRIIRWALEADREDKSHGK